MDSARAPRNDTNPGVGGSDFRGAGPTATFGFMNQARSINRNCVGAVDSEVSLQVTSVVNASLND
jgi:hypothetical protein